MAILNRCPENLEICVTRGDSDPLVFDLFDSDGTAFVATGYGYLLTVNTEPDPVDATNQIFQVVGIVGGTGDSQVSFPVSAANNADPGFRFADIQETAPGGEVLTLAKGSYEIRQDITK